MWIENHSQNSNHIRYEHGNILHLVLPSLKLIITDKKSVSNKLCPFRKRCIRAAPHQRETTNATRNTPCPPAPLSPLWSTAHWPPYSTTTPPSTRPHPTTTPPTSSRTAALSKERLGLESLSPEEPGEDCTHRPRTIRPRRACIRPDMPPPRRCCRLIRWICIPTPPRILRRRRRIISSRCTILAAAVGDIIPRTSRRRHIRTSTSMSI